MRLGCTQPAQSPGRYTDAVRRLSDKLHYLYSADERYWYDTRPNLRREMEHRMQRCDKPEAYLPEIQNRLERMIGKGGVIGGVHVFRDDADVPDDRQLRLVVLPPDHAHIGREKDSRAVQLAGRYLQRRGAQLRLNQNQLLFLAADREAYSQLRQHTRAFLAWNSIVNDAEQLNLDPYHQKQATASQQTAEDRVKESLLQTYAWLLAPRQELSPRGELMELVWEDEKVERGGQSFGDNLQQAAIDAEMVIPKWAPVHLRRLCGGPRCGIAPEPMGGTCDREQGSKVFLYKQIALAPRAGRNAMRADVTSPCPRCEGCGQVVGTGRDELPWNRFEAVPLRLMLERVLGLQRPYDCPACSGAGRVPKVAAA